MGVIMTITGHLHLLKKLPCICLLWWTVAEWRILKVFVLSVGSTAKAGVFDNCHVLKVVYRVIKGPHGTKYVFHI
jgi:hypothetical protein